MTIDDLLSALIEQRRVLGGDTTVVALWDGGLSNLDYYGVQTNPENVLIFDVEKYGTSELRYRECGCFWVVESPLRKEHREMGEEIAMGGT